MQKIRVAHVIYNLQRGGAERLTLDICRELNKRNDFESVLIVFDDRNDFPEATGDINIVRCSSTVVLKFPWNVVSDLADWNHIMTKQKPDIIHSHLFYADWVSREHLYKDIAYFSHIHGITTQYERLSAGQWLSRQHAIRLVTGRHIRKRYKACHNQFIANSHEIKRYLQRNLNDKSGMVHLLPNAIDRQRFSSKQHGSSGQLIRLVSTGTLNENKNQAFLLLVVQQLRAKGIPVQLDLLGDGPLLHELEKKVKEYQLENAVHLHGMVQDVEAYLQQADIYVHAASNEPFGLALAEALSVGLPVISLDGKGTRNIVEDGSNGFVVSSHDPELFAKKIMDVAKDENTYIGFSNRARESAEKFDIGNYVDKLTVLYRNELKYRRPNAVAYTT
ncbi:MAG: glycosyltransferase [Chitinophagales bacterium]|nr:glycosyltransferase [Chitinophagales bacterium]